MLIEYLQFIAFFCDFFKFFNQFVSWFCHQAYHLFGFDERLFEFRLYNSEYVYQLSLDIVQVLDLGFLLSYLAH